MKLIGFVKEHNKIDEAKTKDVFFTGEDKDKIVLDEILSYLNKGELIFSWMGYIFDLENQNLIAPDGYYSDGIYVWPSYFPYYLKKHPKFKVDEVFLDHINERKNKTCFMLSKEDKFKLEKELSNKLNPC